ncbi:hypothetical protein BGZ60DRAFT_417398 [Tricladium varicosporioides]|nr:hypothetical protein BGZ60DRAFT_417398 [Hymenoscyphus varicosporioides]
MDNLSSSESKLARQKGRLEYCQNITKYPEFKILQKLIQDPHASVADAVQQTLNITTNVVASEAGLGVHPWHTFVALLEIAKQTSPDEHTKLVEYVFRLQEETVIDETTGEPLKDSDGLLVWKELPAFGYTAHDDWNEFDVSDTENTPEESKRWLNMITFLAQLSSAAEIDYTNLSPSDVDFSFWSLWAFNELNPKGDGIFPTDAAIRAASVWLIYAGDRLWANIKNRKVFNKVGNDPGTVITREMWQTWKQALVSIKSTSIHEEARKLVDEALDKMSRVSAE